jgi:hypothetical protein
MLLATVPLYVMRIYRVYFYTKYEYCKFIEICLEIIIISRTHPLERIH